MTSAPCVSTGRSRADRPASGNEDPLSVLWCYPRANLELHAAQRRTPQCSRQPLREAPEGQAAEDFFEGRSLSAAPPKQVRATDGRSVGFVTGRSQRRRREDPVLGIPPRLPSGSRTNSSKVRRCTSSKGYEKVHETRKRRQVRPGSQQQQRDQYATGEPTQSRTGDGGELHTTRT